jgi:hypothetical protein
LYTRLYTTTTTTGTTFITIIIIFFQQRHQHDHDDTISRALKGDADGEESANEDRLWRSGTDIGKTLRLVRPARAARLRLLPPTPSKRLFV